MPNYDRRERVGEEIKKQLSEIIRGLKEFPIPAIFSILAAEISADFRQCKVHVSMLGEAADCAAFCKNLQSAQGKIRHELGKRVKIHHTPALAFQPDDSIAHSVRISHLIDTLNIPPAPPEEPEAVSEI